ncbi:hypothetical protein Indivirus_2_47 [Indivirus ILV1]|uniref:Transmembrane protein n=1 Tax=Indivirus ILV1 TaxID=1977633 RepID=A0A1V0SDD8_9VIRU|nr:hypothetical protein Indivirus_2_47 [Indivirus ILV1]
MFYNLLYRSPLWGKVRSQDRNIRIIVAGTILYVVSYLLLQTKYVNDISQLQNYKKYIYHLFASDFTIVMIQMRFSHDKKIKRKLKNPKPKKMKLSFDKFIPMNNYLQNHQNDEHIPVIKKKQTDLESDIQIPIYRPINKQVNQQINQEVSVNVD